MMMTNELTPKQRAQKSAQAMWASDRASQWIGMELVEVDEGEAILSLKIEKYHANGHGIGHGGITYSLADSAFAFACNSRNQSTVAQHNSMSYIAPVRLGDTITASAKELSLVGRNGIYDVSITNQKGELVAQFRGCSRAIKGQLFEE